MQTPEAQAQATDVKGNCHAKALLNSEPIALAFITLCLSTDISWSVGWLISQSVN